MSFASPHSPEATFLTSQFIHVVPALAIVVVVLHVTSVFSSVVTSSKRLSSTT